MDNVTHEVGGTVVVAVVHTKACNVEVALRTNRVLERSKLPTSLLLILAALLFKWAAQLPAIAFQSKCTPCIILILSRCTGKQVRKCPGVCC